MSKAADTVGRASRARRPGGRLVAAVVAAGLLATACGSGDGNETASEAGATNDTTASEGAAAGPENLADSVVVGTAVSDDTANPLNEQYSTTQYAAFDSLVRILPGEEPEPRLATEWERTSDTVMEFTLRDDVVFHDGAPVTADDVVFSFDTTVAEGFANATNLDTLAEVRAVDEDTIEVETTEADPLLLDKVSQVFVIPKAYWEEVGPEGFTEAPIGSGPYRIESFSPDAGIEFVAFDDFWGEAPVTQNVTYRYFADPQSLQSALEAGEVDAAHNLDPSAVQTLQGNPGITVSTDWGGGSSMLQINTTAAPFDDPRVREAANIAVDQTALAEALTFGVAPIEDGQVTYEPITGYNPDVTAREADIEAARALVEEAGAEGAEVVIEGLAFYSNLYEAVAGSLTEIGLSPTVRSLEIGPWLEAFRNGTDAHVFYRGLSYTGIFDASRAYRWFTATDKPFVVDEEFDALMQSAATELDESARAEILREATAYVRDNDLVLFTYGTVSPGAVTEGVSGLDFSHGLMLLLENVQKAA